MTTKRPYYRHKWQWAEEAQAARLRQQALELPSGIARSRRRANAEAVAWYYRQAHHYDKLAERFKSEGV